MRWLPTFLLVVFVGFTDATFGAGIIRVEVTKTQISVRVHKNSGSATVAELEPYQTTNDLISSRFVGESCGRNFFTLTIPRFDGARDRLYSGFVLYTNSAQGRVSQGAIHYVENPGDVAIYHEPFPRESSKKGLQIQMVDDAIALGVKHAAYNFNLEQLIDLSTNAAGPEWKVDGVTYHFNRGLVESYDHLVKQLSDSGMTVTLILLCYQSGDAALDHLMLHPHFSKDAPHGLSAFNTLTPDGLRYFKACIEFLADRYSKPGYPHGRVVNFIVSNEVNAHWEWSNLGPATMEQFADDYLRTVRICCTAVHKVSATSRVYLSLEHHWNMRMGDPLHTFAARPFINYFNAQAVAGGNFDWQLAFHPYPEDLNEPRTWNDKSATLADNTPRITFKNIQMLPAYFKRPELLCHGEPRHIILSEQGFNTPKKPEGELWQAAGYCYAYYKISRLAGIDSFILHRQVDYRDEFGLNLGLWRRDKTSSAPSAPGSKKPIYEVFQLADTGHWRQAFAFALPIIGIKNWSDVNLNLVPSPGKK